MKLSLIKLRKEHKLKSKQKRPKLKIFVYQILTKLFQSEVNKV